jgi:Na+/melibiose symporter-like transporter
MGSEPGYRADIVIALIAAIGCHERRRLRLPSWRSQSSFGSALSAYCFLSFASLFSAGSVLSIGSAGSILSIGSAGSILSMGSAGSILSIGALGGFRTRSI